MNRDLCAARARIVAGELGAADMLRASIGRLAAPESRHSFISTDEPGAGAVAAAVDTLRAVGAPTPPLAGLAISIKDLFDVHAQVSAAGSKVLRQAAPATSDAPAVARLRRAGAALIGRTNMSEFAFSGVGLNPHHGTPANPATARLDPLPRIPGGSTSGGAVSVATGSAWAALGSDTGGSIRIPAALQGLVGFKNTARLTPTDGAVPLSRTLDTVCAITLSVRDAVLLHEVLAERRPMLTGRPLAALRLAVPRTLMLDTIEPAVAAAFERALATLRTAGAQIEEIPLAELGELAGINSGGGFAPVEAWAWHRHRLAAHEADYDPRVAQRIRRGQTMSAADYLDLVDARRDWIARLQPTLRRFDALLSPTVPCLAPPLEPLLTDDRAFFAANTLLLRNPSVVNVLDGCALSLPCQPPGALPVGLMVWNGALRDDDVLDASLAIEAALAAAAA